jgi:hypothetical protein
MEVNLQEVRMPMYCRLKDGSKMVVMSDNTDEETMNVFPVEELPYVGTEFGPISKLVSYSDIACTDTNKTIAYATSITVEP